MRIALIIVLLSGILYRLQAQPDHEEAGNFTPGISSIALYKGQMEFNLFNGFVHKLGVFNWAAPPFQELEGNQNSWQSLLQFTYGVSGSRNLNLGLDLSYVRFNSNYTFSGSDTGFQASGFNIGPRIRWRPAGKISEDMDLTLQHYVTFPIARADTLFPNKPSFGNQVIFTRRFGFDWTLMAQLDIIILPKTTVDMKTPITTPLTLFASYIYRSNLIFYGLTSFKPEYGSVGWAEDDRYYRRRFAGNIGGGFQWSPPGPVDLYAHYLFAFAVTRDGGGNSLNFGVRMVIP